VEEIFSKTQLIIINAKTIVDPVNQEPLDILLMIAQDLETSEIDRDSAAFHARAANPVRLNNRYLDGMNRRSKYESLKLLERLGEVQVQRQKGKSPLVTICCLPLKAAAAPGGGH
jgi:hypothetical protein